MTDTRRTPANGRVAAHDMVPFPTGHRAVEGAPFTVSVPVADLLRRPEGPRDRQLLLGANVLVFETVGEWCFVQALADDYVGYVARSCLHPTKEPATHSVQTPATHAYAEPNMKSPDLLALSFGARLRVIGENGSFFQTEQGFVPRGHLQHCDDHMQDPIAVAELFLGTPYLWGGNSRAGIDCSGLVQAALLACGIPCPGDSYQQEQELGRAIPLGACQVPDDLQRGDLLFWKGHVALMHSADTMIHANAHHMAVVLEPVDAAVARILDQGDGPVTCHRRLTE
ncbi:C40 family peptidase [Phaeobacter sp.]|uniref:C40 family peptidase n=1 Tax=Phaeobacter sp. TaxID=1902409 RepID=UPI0025FA272A|nr:C40 family peptidase [Phaeobacter sp.]